MNFHQPAWYFLWSLLTSGGFLFKLVVKGLVHLKMKISTFIVMSFLNIKKYLRRGHKNCVFVCLYIQKKESHTDFGMTWRWVNEDNFHVWVNWTTASKAQHIKLVINREEEWLAELWVIFKVACFFFFTLSFCDNKCGTFFGAKYRLELLPSKAIFINESTNLSCLCVIDRVNLLWTEWVSYYSKLQM